jgi:hypothetical protein
MRIKIRAFDHFAMGQNVDMAHGTGVGAEFDFPLGADYVTQAEKDAIRGGLEFAGCRDSGIANELN